MIEYLSSLPSAVAQGIIWGVMAIGLFITFKILDFADLTVDGSITTGAAVCAMLIVNGCPVAVAMLAAFAAGMLAGLVTGLFHTFMGIPPILSGILTQLILWSVNLKIMGKANQALPARNYFLLVSQLNRTRSILVLAAVVIVLIAILYWFFGTEYGASIRATGCNLHMSRAQGINTAFTKIIALMLSNGIVALAGALLGQYLGMADINMGRGAIVIGLAAIIIGEALFARIARNFAMKLLAVVGGGIIYFFVYQTIVFLGLDTDLLKMLSAVVVAIFLAIPYWKKKYFTFAKTPQASDNLPFASAENPDGEVREEDGDHA